MPSPTDTPADALLKASNLNRYLSVDASINDVSLLLRRGDVLGLLGLNGAGKSTTLKMLAGTLVPDSGEISVAGYSMAEHPLQARQHIGYLPDIPPLYQDMRVIEYLRFCARLRRVPKALVQDKVLQVLDRCDLHEVAKQRIGKLSKGFKQRVGLAQAQVHEPEVLLLDEPSNGLDPNQMQGMRRMIEHAGKQQAVIFSTHLLSEAKAVCNRVAVVHHGRLIHEADVNGTDDQLQAIFAELGQPQAQSVST